MIRTVLVPLDGSPSGEHALSLAAGVARRAGAAGIGRRLERGAAVDACSYSVMATRNLLWINYLDKCKKRVMLNAVKHLYRFIYAFQ